MHEIIAHRAITFFKRNAVLIKMANMYIECKSDIIELVEIHLHGSTIILENYSAIWTVT